MTANSTPAALFILLATSLATAQEQAASPTSPSAATSSIGYATVDEALQSLRAKPGVSITVTTPDSWVIATEPQTYTQWSFTPPGHYAHPTVVRREVKEDRGTVSVTTSALCQAEKSLCDRLIEEFTQLNERMRQSIQSRLKGSASK